MFACICAVFSYLALTNSFFYTLYYYLTRLRNHPSTDWTKQGTRARFPTILRHVPEGNRQESRSCYSLIPGSITGTAGRASEQARFYHLGQCQGRREGERINTLILCSVKTIKNEIAFTFAYINR